MKYVLKRTIWKPRQVLTRRGRKKYRVTEVISEVERALTPHLLRTEIHQFAHQPYLALKPVLWTGCEENANLRTPWCWGSVGLRDRVPPRAGVTASSYPLKPHYWLASCLARHSGGPREPTGLAPRSGWLHPFSECLFVRV